MLQQQINEDLKGAMKSKEVEKLSTLRMLNAALLNYSVEKLKKGQELADDEVIFVVSREIKQRRDAVAEYEKGGRPELAAKESDEIKVLEKYLPAQLSEEEVRKVVSEIIAAGASDIGRAMGQSMAKLKGKADGTLVRKIVEEMMKK